jgi:hypothetical protein
LNQAEHINGEQVLSCRLIHLQAPCKPYA